MSAPEEILVKSWGDHDFTFNEKGVFIRKKGETYWEPQCLTYCDLTTLLRLKNDLFEKYKPYVGVATKEWRKEVARRLTEREA